MLPIIFSSEQLAKAFCLFKKDSSMHFMHSILEYNSHNSSLEEVCLLPASSTPCSWKRTWCSLSDPSESLMFYSESPLQAKGEPLSSPLRHRFAPIDTSVSQSPWRHLSSLTQGVSALCLVFWTGNISCSTSQIHQLLSESPALPLKKLGDEPGEMKASHE